ncbi:hypothetical protein [Flavivirga eckloniae]|uniref:Uncharacterized protein n=1 Tax=Flavivirga eckloniae TaxID=1803846 RepID=A0A2K9PR52_9FLAO|nr:hypothetical protein [Flavivirga eckloniae]AUP79515.1 hypothetical protein C1H87_12680 [Flavivirga eckloniae]
MTGKQFCILLLTFLLGEFCLVAQDIENISQQDPFKISGTIGATGTYFNADGRQANREPFSWVIYGSPTISIYGVDIPFSFTFSEQNRDFRQPFNQFGLSPTYKWATVHLGHRNLKWSEFALAGHNFFGGGFEVTPKNFRIGAVYGRFLKPIEPNSATSGTTYDTPAFRRVGSAFKVGYGSEKNNADIVVFQAKDDVNSIDVTNAPPTLTPQENVVASIKTHHLFFEKLSFDAEYARSIYTPNTETVSVNNLNDPIVNTFSFLIDERQGTRVGDAILATLGFKEKTYEIKLRYNRIDPDFKSLGAYFFLTDLEKITIEPRVKFWKNKLVVAGSFGIQKDNLNAVKNAQTKRNIYSTNINFTPIQQYNLNANYTNYGITQKPGTQPINNQMEIAQVNQQLTVTQNVNLLSKDNSIMHMLLLLWNFQNLTDDNSNTSAFSEFQSHILSPRYTFSYNPWRFTTGIGYNYSIFKFTTRETKNFGPSVTLSKAFQKPNINLSTTFNHYEIVNDGIKDSNAFTIRFQGKYRLTKKHQFSLRGFLNNGNTTGINPLNYSETKIDFGYVYTF